MSDHILSPYEGSRKISHEKIVEAVKKIFLAKTIKNFEEKNPPKDNFDELDY